MPWLLHGDGAPFSEIDSVTVISMRCAISGVTIKLSQLLLTCLPKTATTSSSMKPLWEAIAGSFKKMAHEGSGVLFVVAGDLEWFSAEFGWPTAMSNFPCPFCKADNLFDMGATKHPFTDFRKEATWKSTLKGVHSPPPLPHALFTVPGESLCLHVGGKVSVCYRGWLESHAFSVCYKWLQFFFCTGVVMAGKPCVLQLTVCWVVAGKPCVLFLLGGGWKAKSFVSVSWVAAGTAMV